jgi:hypothetical protein
MSGAQQLAQSPVEVILGAIGRIGDHNQQLGDLTDHLPRGGEFCPPSEL